MAATVATPTARSGDGPLPVAAGPRDASAVYMRDFAAALDAVDAQITAAETGAGSVPGVSGSLSPSAQPNLVVHMRNVTKTYLLGIEGVPALRGVSVSIQRGEFIVILGKSGGGKTTMLNILGTVDKPTRGDLYISGVRVDAKTPDNVLADIRLRKLGFVFQTFNLLPALTAVENVELPMILANRGTAASRRKRAVRLLTQVGMAERLWHVPNQMSGGEQQRVTIARALANEPDILLLDEPTGDLDGNNSLIVMNMLTQLNTRAGVTCIMVTHDVALKSYAHRVLHMVDGKIARIEVIPAFVREDALETLAQAPAVRQLAVLQARRRATAALRRGRLASTAASDAEEGEEEEGYGSDMAIVRDMSTSSPHCVRGSRAPASLVTGFSSAASTSSSSGGTFGVGGTQAAASAADGGGGGEGMLRRAVNALASWMSPSTAAARSHAQVPDMRQRSTATAVVGGAADRGGVSDTPHGATVVEMSALSSSGRMFTSPLCTTTSSQDGSETSATVSGPLATGVEGGLPFKAEAHGGGSPPVAAQLPGAVMDSSAAGGSSEQSSVSITPPSAMPSHPNGVGNVRLSAREVAREAPPREPSRISSELHVRDETTATGLSGVAAISHALFLADIRGSVGGGAMMASPAGTRPTTVFRTPDSYAPHAFAQQAKSRAAQDAARRAAVAAEREAAWRARIARVHAALPSAPASAQQLRPMVNVSPRDGSGGGGDGGGAGSALDFTAPTSGGDAASAGNGLPPASLISPRV